MSWVKFFTANTSDYEGYVESEAQLQSLVEAYELETNAHYVKIRSRDKYKINLDEIDYKLMKLCWSDTKSRQEVIVPRISEDCVPFIQLGSCSLECHQGSSRKLKNVKDESQAKDDSQKTKKAVISKKLGCPSMIRIRRVQKFIDYKVESAKSSKIILSYLHDKLRNEETRKEVKIENRFYVHIPSKTSHKNHVTGEEADVNNGIIDKRLSVFIRDKITKENLSSTKEMMSFVHEYVEHTLFKGKSLPPTTNTRYWPSLTQVRNQMITFNVKRRNTALNDEELEKLADNWRREYPGDSIRLRLKSSKNNRKCTQTNGGGPMDGGEPKQKSKFLFVHQTNWQRRLLALYGDEICILEVYRPTKYATPLFFLLIPTNCFFTVVATFITETEAQIDIEEALITIKSWNNMWNPRCIMTKFCEAEIAAVENVFKGGRTELFFCDYHRLHTWNRWLSNETSKVDGFKDQVWKLMVNVAESYSEMVYQENLQILRSCEGWKSSQSLQRWFEKWITNAARWVKVYRQDRFIVIDTNSGMENVNSIIKQMYLRDFTHEKTQTVSELAEITITRFLPCLHSKYCQTNVKWNDNALNYNLPFLNNRPAYFVDQVVQRWEDSQAVVMNNVFVQDSFGTFHIMSSSSRMSHEILLENGYGMPSCGCIDWKTNHYPCKHILAGISSGTFAWDDLPTAYKDSPFLTLDFVCINTNSAKENGDGGNEGYAEALVNCQVDEAEEFRSYLKKLEDLSFLSYNKEVFHKLNLNLRQYITDLSNTCPMDGPYLKGSSEFGQKVKSKSPQKKGVKRKFDDSVSPSVVIETDSSSVILPPKDDLLKTPTKIKVFMKSENQNQHVYSTILNL